jgi:hypothetical protein
VCRLDIAAVKQALQLEDPVKFGMQAKVDAACILHTLVQLVVVSSARQRQQRHHTQAHT